MVHPSGPGVPSNDVPYVWYEHCQSVLQLLPFPVLGRSEKEQQRLDENGTKSPISITLLRYSFISTDKNRHEEGEEKEPIAS